MKKAKGNISSSVRLNRYTINYRREMCAINTLCVAAVRHLTLVKQLVAAAVVTGDVKRLIAIELDVSPRNLQILYLCPHTDQSLPQGAKSKSKFKFTRSDQQARGMEEAPSHPTEWSIIIATIIATIINTIVITTTTTTIVITIIATLIITINMFLITGLIQRLEEILTSCHAT